MGATREPAAAPEPAADRREAYARAGPPGQSATPREVVERAREGGTVGREVARARPAPTPDDGESPTDAAGRRWGS